MLAEVPIAIESILLATAAVPMLMASSPSAFAATPKATAFWSLATASVPIATVLAWVELANSPMAIEPLVKEPPAVALLPMAIALDDAFVVSAL